MPTKTPDQSKPVIEPTTIGQSAQEITNRLLAKGLNDAQVSEREKIADSRARSKAVADLAGQLGLRYSPKAMAISSFSIYDSRQSKVIETVKRLAESLPSWAVEGRGVLFFGTVGTGKDHLLASLLYIAAASGLSCKWVNGQEVYGQFRDRMDTGQREEDLLSELCRPQVLAISDPVPPTGNPTPFNVSQLYRLTDRRYRAKKSTWMTVNGLSPEDLDSKLSAPLFDRLREDAELLGCFWPSYRERSK